MSEYDIGKWERPLPFPLGEPIESEYVENPSGAVTITAPDFFPDDEPDTKIDIHVRMSMSEFTAIASAIDIGRDIGFGERSYELWRTWCKALIGVITVSCEDIADCIETNEATQAAIASAISTSETIENSIIQQLTNNNYAPSGNGGSPTNVTMTSSQQSQNLLPDGFECDYPQLMAICRQVILEVHGAMMDFFEAVEVNTNLVEAGNILTDGVPVAGTVNNTTEFADWMIESVTEQYQAAYNQEVEDTLACALFCLAEPECNLTYEMILDMYAGFAEGDFGLPSNANDFQSVVDWALGLTLTVSLGTVSALHYIIVNAMKFGLGTVFQMSGLTSLRNIIRQAQGYQDFTYDTCECVEEPDPTLYWRWYGDFRQGAQGTTASGATVPAGLLTNQGWGVNPSIGQTTSNANFVMPDWGDAWVVRAAGTRSLRRGSAGNGTHDYSNVVMFTGANKTGSSFSFGQNAITENTNDVTKGQISPLHATAYRSWEGRNRCAAAPNAGGDVRVYEVVIWGVAGAGDTKPPNSVWAGNTLPATIPELFPSV